MQIEQSIVGATTYPVGVVFDVSFKEFSVRLTTLLDKVRFEIAQGPYARTEEVDIVATPIRPGVFIVSWVEKSGATVVHVEDFAQGRLYSHATLRDGTFLRMEGDLRIVDQEFIG